ncbi:MAG: glycosyltransferase family 4 protein [Aggregatilineales bacterium]
MQLLILSQYYSPEIGAAAIRLSRLARLLAADGHLVTVLTGMPNYPAGKIQPPYRGKLIYRERLDGVDVRRVWLYTTPSKRARARILNQLSFMGATALWGMSLPRPDVILVESHPLFVTLTGGWLRRLKRAPVVLNVSDLWPESAVATGVLRAGSTIVKVAQRVERWAYGDAAHIVGMTQGVVDGILRVHPRPERVSLITNAVDLERFQPADAAMRERARRVLGLPFDRPIAVHIGNMSLTYDFEIILSAAEYLPEILFVFVGDGSQAAYVASEIETRQLENVQMLGVLPHEEMPRVWSAADVCLIALADHALAAGTRPAKLYEAFATGTPIIAAIRGEGAAVIEQAEAGIVVAVGDRAGYIAALKELATSPERRERMSAAGRAFAEKAFSPLVVKQAYQTVFEQVTRNKSSISPQLT